MDIYPACKISGTCPPDILNRYEQNTIADKILKYGSIGVYLGSLGIGTGKGTGGSLGYNPLGTRPSVSRPGPPIQSVGPSDIPLDVITPTDSVIITPQEVPIIRVPTGPNFEGPILPPRFPSIVEDPIEIPSVEEPAVLPVEPTEVSVPTQTTSQFSNPAFEITHYSIDVASESSASDHVFINGQSGGHFVGGEDIELVVLGRGPGGPRQIEAETEFTTSTPESFPTRRTGLYGRGTQQVRVETEAIVRPRWNFENPAFEESVSLTFDSDIADLAAALPRDEYIGVTNLGKEIYSQRQGLVRVSRLGSRLSNLQTRSGEPFVGKVHFFTDLSEIPLAESIELSTFSENSNASLGSVFPEETLIDEYESVGENLQLVLTEGRAARHVQLRDYTRVKKTGFSNSDFDFFDVRDKDLVSIDPATTPYTPVIVIHGVYFSVDFYLHPHLLKRRKRFHF
ncbi:L2 protein [Talpa europaea papillomavirus 1]|uniref:Minor capsid protein L2 n=1 Tax=Talpa europaea papillomavirus 1 TaxID=1338506 RepID=R9RYS7_9PAPI|nr:L2 protein [Talpa europaea papillomavirus 1]AGM75117.1 L2 protein [Talpa europaea papillomavirus 1]